MEIPSQDPEDTSLPPNGPEDENEENEAMEIENLTNTDKNSDSIAYEKEDDLELNLSDDLNTDVDLDDLQALDGLDQDDPDTMS